MSSQKNIIITGVSSHLGGVLARHLARDPGVTILATMRRPLGAEKFPANVHVLDECDLVDTECCHRLAKAATRLFRKEFGLVHCAGDFWHHVPFMDCPPANAKTTFESHVTTLYNTLQALIPAMRKRKGGNVVTFTCNSAIYHYPWMAAFTASKSAVDSLMTSLANEFSGDNLRFNSLRLSSLKTKTVHRSKPKSDFEDFTPPGDLVPVVRFLLSPEAYLINGNSITLFKHSDGFYRRGYFERIAL